MNLSDRRTKILSEDRRSLYDASQLLRTPILIPTQSKPQTDRQDWPQPVQSRLQRWLLAAVGVLFVGLGAVGVFVPGLPTTIFLILASWCFARSCPWLEERLLHNALFRPFLVYLRPGARMPRRAVVTTLVVMWLAILVSVLTLSLGENPSVLLAASVVVLGLVGTRFVVRLGEARADA